MNLDMKKIGEYIQLRRKLTGMTQAQLGERLHVTAQSISNWERGLLLPDTATLPDLAHILDTTVDCLLTGGDCPLRFRRRMTVERLREAMGCIQRLREILGAEHPFFRTMVDALDARLNSSIETAFQREGAMDAYLCEALLFCIDQGDYVDRDNVKAGIANERAASAVIARLDAMGIR
ncbi:MAG: helix-turn-helix transcriptional regulator [Clostridia bacterium]|nr:helix-turn-helix transcriptional regulator [Clostridia bacterium]